MSDYCYDSQIESITRILEAQNDKLFEIVNTQNECLEILRQLLTSIDEQVREIDKDQKTD